MKIPDKLFFWKNKKVSSTSLSSLKGMPENVQKQTEFLIESIADGVVVADTNAKISLINPAASIMSEWSSADAMGVDINLVLKLTTDADKVIPTDTNPFAQVLKTNQKIETTVTLTGHQGKKMIVSLVVSPILINKTSAGIVAVLRDITAQRTAEKQRADFISTASHEMRTPVAAIEGYISLAMNDKVSSVDSRAKDFLEKAHQSTRQLSKLFQDLLTSSRAEDGRLVNKPVVVEVNSYIQRLAESFQLAAEKKHLIVDFVSIAASGGAQPSGDKVVAPLYYIHVDPDRFSEVITNIFDNAVKYTEAGKITIGIGGDNNVVQVFINDTGPGIPADDIPHLFQKFYRVDNSSIRTVGGTGLGLFICKKIVELYGGQLWVESELGKGSTFRINIPRLTTQQAEALKRTETIEDAVAMPSSNPTL